MSKEEVARFAQDLKSNSDLQAAAKSAGSDAESLAQFADKRGYDFSAKELHSYADDKKGELSDEDLDKVAGGGDTVTAVVVDVVVV